jgi:hypothetical protein
VVPVDEVRVVRSGEDMGCLALFSAETPVCQGSVSGCMSTDGQYRQNGSGARGKPRTLCRGRPGLSARTLRAPRDKYGLRPPSGGRRRRLRGIGSQAPGQR